MGTMKNKKREALIELLNFEGPVLSAIRKGDGSFSVIDEHKVNVANFTKRDFLEFISGMLTVTDSRDRTWNFTNQHPEARQDYDKLMDFINSDGIKVSRESAKSELLELYETQIADLAMMSKIELGDDVISEIQRLKKIING
jgi:hypothetical protein